MSPINRVFITIDTEEDGWGEYKSSGFSAENIKKLSALQNLFDRYGAIPTYLVSYQVATNNQARNLLLDIFSRGNCEIGAHCHPWNTPPFEEELSEHNSMLSNLPYDLVIKKIKTLHKAIIEAFGVVPRSFRAGRWGFSPAVAKAIYELGYCVDTSVTPCMDWRPSQGPDYRQAPNRLYRFHPDEILKKVAYGPLWQAPVTIGFLQKNFSRSNRICQWTSVGVAAKFHLRGLLEKAGILNFRWLSPEWCNGENMIALAKISLASGCTDLNMTFHSTSLMPENGRYISAASDQEGFLRNIEEVLIFAKNSGLVFKPLSDVAESIKAVP